MKLPSLARPSPPQVVQEDTGQGASPSSIDTMSMDKEPPYQPRFTLGHTLTGVVGLATLGMGCVPTRGDGHVGVEIARADAPEGQQEVLLQGKITTIFGALRSVGFSNSDIARGGLVEEVVRLNGLANPNEVQFGQHLTVPTPMDITRDPVAQPRLEVPRVAPQAPAAVAPLSFGQRLRTDQKVAIHNIAIDLSRMGFGVRADDVANFIAVETGGKFDPAVRAPGGAVGLAQFTNIAIKDMNQRRPSTDQLSKDKLAQMDFTEQSKVVTDYLSTVLKRRGMSGRQVSGPDLYSAVFAPIAVGKPANYSIYREGSEAYRANKSLDVNLDGHITKTELTSRLRQWALSGSRERG